MILLHNQTKENEMSSGGRREGSGRKSKFGEKTVVLRVPESMLEFVQNQIDNVQIQNDYARNQSFDSVQIQPEIVQIQNNNNLITLQNQIDNVHNQKIVIIQEIIDKYEANANDSPRWVQAKNLIAELKKVLS